MEFTYLTQNGDESRKECSSLIVDNDHAYCASESLGTRDIVHFDDAKVLELTDDLQVRCDEIVTQIDGVVCKQALDQDEYSWREIRKIE